MAYDKVDGNEAGAAVSQEPVAELKMTVLGSGSSGNCSLISCGEVHVLIDAGFSGKEIERRLALRGFDANDLTAVLVTHEHSDHIRSVHTLSHRYRIPLFCTQGTFGAAVDGKRFYDWVEVTPGRCFKLGEMWFYPISLPHDAEDPIGFRVETGDRVLAHMTDFGYGSGLVRESLRGCDTIMVEANHDLEMLKDGPYPWPLKQRIASRLGHLSNEAMLEMLPEMLHDGLKHMVLGHLSDTNNDPRLLTISLKRALRRLGMPDLPFTIALQDTPLETMTV